MLWVEQLAVCSHTNFINDSGFQINKDGTGHMLSTSGLSKEGVEGVIMSSNSLVRGHLTIRLDSMVEAVDENKNIIIFSSYCLNMNKSSRKFSQK